MTGHVLGITGSKAGDKAGQLFQPPTVSAMVSLAYNAATRSCYDCNLAIQYQDFPSFLQLDNVHSFLCRIPIFKMVINI